jgi:hypothetical protein
MYSVQYQPDERNNHPNLKTCLKLNYSGCDICPDMQNIQAGSNKLEARSKANETRVEARRRC